MTDRYFHYTSISSLYEIVRNKKVWFSSLAFMNDEMEGLELFASLKEASEARLSDSEKELFETLIKTSVRWQFIYSASRLEDDISQWRAYTELGQGVCIEFNNDFVSDARTERVECIYDRQAKEELIRRYGLHVTGSDLDKAISNPSIEEGYLSNFVHALSSLKHHSFKPEDEVRWVVSLGGISDSSAQLNYRSHRLGLVPYLAIPIDINCISTVWLGPKVLGHNKESVEDFLMMNDCPGLVRQSKVALR